ncbi:MAG: ATP phosphoribosyltransferase regulatory subunit, partial [Agrococcus casei]
ELAAGSVPDGIDEDQLATVRELLEADCGVRLEFDPSLVRGMGYYTGAIYEIAHPDLPYSIGGGGRYDGMIGRFSGTDVPAAGISLGFERLVDLVELEDDGIETIGLIVDKRSSADALIKAKRALISEGKRVVIAKQTNNMKSVMAQIAEAGATHFAFVTPSTDASAIEVKPLD